MNFHKDILHIDCKAEAGRLCDFIKQQVVDMKRDGAVIGISGGIDSAVAATLCVKALGKDRVFGLVLPERESNPVSAKYAVKHAEALGLRYITVDITPTLEGFGTYQKRDNVIYFAMYHPAAALHQQSLQQAIEADMLKIPSLLAETKNIQEVQPEPQQLNMFEV